MVASILAQTYPDWELIVVDDSPEPTTAEAAREAARGDPRVRIRRFEERIGYARAFNVALGMARGARFLAGGIGGGACVGSGGVADRGGGLQQSARLGEGGQVGGGDDRIVTYQRRGGIGVDQHVALPG